MFQLDAKDRLILFELDKDARKSASQIGKQVKLLQEVVNYRIRRLEEVGIIKRYVSLTQFFKLNYSIIKICLQFQHLPKEIHDEMIVFLKQRPEVMWVVECNGRWDLIVTFSVSDLMAFDNAKTAFFAKYSTFIANKSTSLVLEYRASPRQYLVQNTKVAQHVTKVSFQRNSTETFDKTDFGIIQTLSTQARIPITELAKTINTTPKIANYRLNKLIKNGVILGSRLSLDLEKIGYKFFKSFIYLENASNKRKEALLNFCDAHPNIIHSVVTIGEWDFEAEFEVQSNEEFYIIINYMRSNFSDIIKTIETVLISKEYELHYF